MYLAGCRMGSEAQHGRGGQLSAPSGAAAAPRARSPPLTATREGRLTPPAAPSLPEAQPAAGRAGTTPPVPPRWFPSSPPCTPLSHPHIPRARLCLGQPHTLHQPRADGAPIPPPQCHVPGRKDPGQTQQQCPQNFRCFGKRRLVVRNKTLNVLDHCDDPVLLMLCRLCIFQARTGTDAQGSGGCTHRPARCRSHAHCGTRPGNRRHQAFGIGITRSWKSFWNVTRG